MPDKTIPAATPDKRVFSQSEPPASADTTTAKIIAIHPECKSNAPRSPALKLDPPSLTIRLGIDRVVFLVTELLELPELDVYPVADCAMRFRMLPGLLLSSPARHVICPLTPDRGAIPIKIQLLSAAMENENPYFGLSLFAKITEALEYTQFIPETPSTLLPHGLVRELFPREMDSLDLTGIVQKHKVPPDRLDKIPIRVNFQLPSGYDLPEIHRGKIVRISLSLYARAGGLAPNGTPLLVNSRSRPTLIHVGSSGFNPPAADYYQLRGVSQDLPATSKLPDVYEDYSEILDPTAAMLARRGIKI